MIDVWFIAQCTSGSGHGSDSDRDRGGLQPSIFAEGESRHCFTVKRDFKRLPAPRPESCAEISATL